MDILKNRREELCLKFALKYVKHDKIKIMFTFNSKSHDMDTRENEKYEVHFANNGRLNKSSIPYMQRLLYEN